MTALVGRTGRLQAGLGSERRFAAVVAAAVFAVVLAVNVPMTPDAPLSADGASFALAAVRVGQPHLPYPIHTLLSTLFARLPFGSAAFGVNLLSGVAAAGAAAGTYLLVLAVARRMSGGDQVAGLVVAHFAGVAAALHLAVSKSFWSVSVAAEVYTLSIAITVSWLLLLVRWERRGGRWTLAAVALLASLSWGAHYFNVLLAPVAIAYVLSSERRREALAPGTLFAVGAAIAIGLAQFAYVPLRPVGPPPEVASLEHYWNFNLGQQARGFLSVGSLSGGSSGVRDPLGFAGAFLVDEFRWGAPLALAGGLAVWRRSRRPAALLTGLFVMNRLAAAAVADDPTLRDDLVFFLTPSNLILAVFAGLGVVAIAGWLRQRASTAAAVTAAGVMAAASVGGLAWAHHGEPAAKASHASEFEAYSVALLEGVEPDSVILTDWTFGTPLWFYQRARGLRPDVEVISLWPHEWPGFIAERLEKHTIYMTHHAPETLEGVPSVEFLRFGWMESWRATAAQPEAK